MPHNYFKSAVLALDQKNDSGSQDDAQQNCQYSHGFTPDASNGLTGPIQSRLGDGLGSKESPVVLEKDERDTEEAQDTEAAYGRPHDKDTDWGGFGPPTPRFKKWYDVKKDCYVLLEKEEVVARGEEERGDQDEEAKGVGMAPMAEEPCEDMILRPMIVGYKGRTRVKQQSPTPSSDLPPEPTQKERDGSANCYDGHNTAQSVQDDERKHYTLKDPNILPADSDEQKLVGDSEQQESSSNKRHDLNAQFANSIPAWMAITVKVSCYDNSTATEQDSGDAEFLITISDITADTMSKMPYPIYYEIERRLQEIPNCFKPDNHDAFGSSLPTSPPQFPPKAKKRGRPASQAQPFEAKKRGRPPKARALDG